MNAVLCIDYDLCLPFSGPVSGLRWLLMMVSGLLSHAGLTLDALALTGCCWSRY